MVSFSDSCTTYLNSETYHSGNGRLITICDVDSPPAYPVMTQMNFSKELTADVLSSLNWATADEAYTPRGFLYTHGVVSA